MVLQAFLVDFRIRASFHPEYVLKAELFDFWVLFKLLVQFCLFVLKISTNKHVTDTPIYRVESNV